MSVAVHLSKVTASALLAGALVAGVQAAASASTTHGGPPAVTVSPNSGLSSPAEVTANATGFTPNTTEYANECAKLAEATFVCDTSSTVPSISFTTDADGKGSATLTVAKTFDGYTNDGKFYGPVDCSAHTCVVVVGNGTEAAASDALSFS